MPQKKSSGLKPAKNLKSLSENLDTPKDAPKTQDSTPLFWDNLTEEKYLELINREPSDEMVKIALNKEGNPMYKYIPKSVLQRELRSIYKSYTKFELLREFFRSDGMWGSGLLHYKHPVSGEWLFVSGTAFLPNIFEPKLNYPKLESAILVNACKKIGPWFGQLLNSEEEDAIVEEGLPVIQIQKKKMDPIIKRKYENAIKQKDQKTIDEILLNYNIPPY